MFHRSLFVVAVMLLAALPAQAEFVIDQATNHHADCSGPALASSPDGLTMLAYNASGYPLLMDFVQVQAMQTIWTDAIVWPDPILLNSGSGPVICWGRTGFHVAFASGDMILIYHADHQGIWDMDDYVLMPPGGALMGLDIVGLVSNATGPDAMLTVMISTNPPSADFQVLYTFHSEAGWSELEEVVTDMQIRPEPRITFSVGSAEPWPTIFFYGGNPEDPVLHSTTRKESTGWSAPLPVPGVGGSSAIVGDFDVVTHYGVNHNLLGLGAQPTCPCGVIYHQEYLLGGGWTDEEDMTVVYADYDWPRSPHLAVGADGELHAFWIQQASASDLTPLRTTLEYWVREGESWSEQSDNLNVSWPGNPTFDHVALTVEPGQAPVLAWAHRDTFNGEPLPEQIWIARVPSSSPVPDPEVVRPKVVLSAWPNPFNPQVKIAFAVERSQAASLIVFDARGGRVADLLARVVEAGRTEVAWHGCDDAGRRVPSGVYFVRLETDDQQLVCKVVMAE